MMEKELCNGFWRDLTSMSSHHVSQNMDGNADGLALSCVEIQPMQNEPQQNLNRLWSHRSISAGSRCTPLKQVAFWGKMFIFGAGSRGMDHRDFSMALL